MSDPLNRAYAYWKPMSQEDYDEYNKALREAGKEELPTRKNKQKYTYEAEPIENGVSPQGHKYWNSLNVSIHDENNNKVAEYKRNYSSMYKTFYSFTINGKDYALYSKDYTATSIMELPSGKEIWTEPRDSFGFCPVEFFVPDGSPFGFVSGCVWGDDSSWKLECIDLRRIEEGIAKRIHPFGYCPLPSKKDSIEDCIEYFHYNEDGDERLYAQILTEYEFSHQFNPIKTEDIDKFMGDLSIGQWIGDLEKYIYDKVAPYIEEHEEFALEAFDKRIDELSESAKYQYACMIGHLNLGHSEKQKREGDKLKSYYLSKYLMSGDEELAGGAKEGLEYIFVLS